MSKLFNTLEKIRHHETRTSPLRRPSPKSKKSLPKSGSKGILIGMCALFGVLLIYTTALYKQLGFTTLYANVQQFAQRLHITLPDTGAIEVEQKIAVPLVTTQEQTITPTPSSPKEPTLPEQMATLNNKGTEFVAQGDYWRGLYYFDQARQIQPQSPEPLINMAVALSELGLSGPAGRIFQQAYRLSPQHPGLQKNLRTLAQLGLLEDSLRNAIQANEPIKHKKPEASGTETKTEQE